MNDGVGEKTEERERNEKAKKGGGESTVFHLELYVLLLTRSIDFMFKKSSSTEDFFQRKERNKERKSRGKALF